MLNKFNLPLRYALKELNLLGEDMHYVPLEEIGIMRNLRSVGLSKVRNYGAVTPSQVSRWWTRHGMEGIQQAEIGPC